MILIIGSVMEFVTFTKYKNIQTSIMSQQSTRRSYRNDRNGQRRGRSSGRRSYSSQSNSTPKQAPKPTGFFAKILAFLTGKPTTKTSDRSSSSTQRREPRESRKPEQIEVTSPRLYVGNLSYDVTESELYEIFKGVGTVQNAEIVYNQHTHRSKGFAFVQMQSIDEAKRAVAELHDQEVQGRKLVVSGAKSSSRS